MGVRAFKEIIYDCILAVLILSLIAAVLIPAYRESIDMIALSTNVSNGMAKVQEHNMLITGRNEVTGSDVVAAVRYYSKSTDTEIVVTDKYGRSKSYINESYNPDEYVINYESTLLPVIFIPEIR